MAIIGPPDLPKVLKADSNPLKLRILHHFGHPNVRVELTEEQMEELLRVTGDFICTYFPVEERYAYFYTQPLVAKYDLPEDAYWVREVAWDPVISRINDVFGAEMFLFCISLYESFVLTEGGMVEGHKLEDGMKVITPYGSEECIVDFHDHDQPMLEIVYVDGSIKCTANQPIKVGKFDVDNALDNWLNASELSVGDELATYNGITTVIDIRESEAEPTVTVLTPSSCFYACSQGNPIVIH